MNFHFKKYQNNIQILSLIKTYGGRCWVSKLFDASIEIKEDIKMFITIIYNRVYFLIKINQLINQTLEIPCDHIKRYVNYIINLKII